MAQGKAAGKYDWDEIRQWIESGLKPYQAREKHQNLYGYSPSPAMFTYHFKEGAKEKTLARTRRQRAEGGQWKGMVDSFIYPRKRNIREVKNKNLRPERIWELIVRIFLNGRDGGKIDMKKVEIWKRHFWPVGKDNSEYFTKDGLEFPFARCYLTGAKINVKVPGEDPMRGTLDHVIPRSRDGENVIENAQLCSLVVNEAKGKSSNEEFIAMCEEVVRYYKSSMIPSLYIKKY